MMGVELRLHLPGMRREHQDAAADDARLLDGMGDEEHRETGVLPELQELLLHLAPGQRVERRERLVHQQDVRLHRHAAGDGHPLLHAAGEHVRIGVLEPVELHLADVLPRDVVGLLAGRAPPPVDQREGDVLLHRLPGQELIELLEHHDPIGARVRDRVPLEPHLALHRMEVARDPLEQGRLAAPRRAEQDEAIGGVDLEPDPVGRGDQVLLGLVLEGDAVDIEYRGGGRGGTRFRRGAAGYCVSHGLSYRPGRSCSPSSSPSSSPPCS